MDQNTASVITTIVTAITALLSTALGSFITYKATKNIERKRLLREKCEAIYDASVQIRQWLDNENNRWWLRIQPDTPVDVDKDSTCPIDKLIMMVDLYAPSLEKEATKIKELVGELNSREFDYRESGLSVFSAYYKDADDVLREDSKMADTTHKELVIAIRRLAKTT